jgi:hypothetical protein
MKKVTDYFKKAPGKYFLVLFLWNMWLYNANVLAHILSIELNGGLQAAATFVFIVFFPILIYVLPENYFDTGESYCLSKVIFDTEWKRLNKTDLNIVK